MAKQSSSGGIFWFLIYSVGLALVSYSYGAKNGIVGERVTKESYTPLYTSRILITKGNDRAIAFTTPKCDSVWAKDDGWWFNKYVNDPASHIVVEAMEWPYEDECK